MRKLTILLALFAFTSMQALMAQITIKGKMTSADDGKPIPGATILVKGTTVGTSTDVNGNYQLNVPNKEATLQFSFVGMITKDIVVGNQTTINVSLETDMRSIEGVVVTALGISRDKKALGYSSQEVKAEDITRTGTPSLSGALQGKLSGLEIKPSSGMPGASTQIIIRGARSFTGNNTPLYVIDGMPVSSTPDYSTGNSVTGADIANRAGDIDPNDIESINVLKGQAAAALYGIRASNGVIVITTKSGKGNKTNKPEISFSNFTSFEHVSRKPEYQTTYAQGVNGKYSPYSSMSWGPKISELHLDKVYGGDVSNSINNGTLRPGLYYVPQLAAAGKNPWVKPQSYDNFGEYFQMGYNVNSSIGISQANDRGHFSVSFSNTNSKGIVLATNSNRYNAKANGATKLSDKWLLGFAANFAKTKIDKMAAANDATIAGVYSAPPSYNLKGIPFALPNDPYSQIYYRSLTFANPYWAAENNEFKENTDRFFGNSYVEYLAFENNKMKLKAKYQIGIDSYTSQYKDVFEYGHRGGAGSIDNYGVTNNTVNSLLTLLYDWKITEDLSLNAIIGNEFNDRTRLLFDQFGSKFNFGGWKHMKNTEVVSATQNRWRDRTVGFFGSFELGYKGFLYLNGTVRQDYVSTMPRNNNSFIYPSVSLSFILTELESMRNLPILSFAKFKASYAEVGQAGEYLDNHFVLPTYGGGFWGLDPIQYPIDGINAYIMNNIQYDPKLKPQNTRSYEVGTELKFIENRIGLDYTYSYQKVTDQIFNIPLAGSTGVYAKRMNGGQIHTNTHEITLYATPVKINDFTWDLTLNFSKINNYVDKLADGVESIFLGGFVTPQVRAGIGTTFPVIYGTSFLRDSNGNIIVCDDPDEWNYGMPLEGKAKVIGKVSPDFILGFSTKFKYKNLSLTSTIDWKSGGQMYHGTNGLLDAYGVSKKTGDERGKKFIFKGVKSDGTPNDIERGGDDDPYAYQDLVADVLTNIDEYYIYDNSFVKLREVTLSYTLPKKLVKNTTLGFSVYARNILLWTNLPNFDPEASQGNNNMGGAFERFSLPQTTSYGFGINLTF